MYSKIIVIVAALCLVQASTIVKIYDEPIAAADAVPNDIDDSSNVILKNVEELGMINNDVVDDGESLDIPTAVRSCTNAACNNVCRALGFRGGYCVSSTVCRCWS